MIEIIIFLLPSVLGLKLFMTLIKNKEIFEYIIYYLLHVLFSNFITIFIFNIIVGKQNNIVEFANNYIIEYMFISLILNIILSIVFTIICKYVTLDIEVKNGKKI